MEILYLSSIQPTKTPFFETWGHILNCFCSLSLTLVRLQRTQKKKSIILNNIGKMSYLWYLSLHERQIFLHHATLLWLTVFLYFCHLCLTELRQQKKANYILWKIYKFKNSHWSILCLTQMHISAMKFIEYGIVCVHKFFQLFLRLDFILPLRYRNQNKNTQTQKIVDIHDKHNV